jgi:mevalonate kinase
VYGYPAIALPVYGLRAFASITANDADAPPMLRIVAEDLNKSIPINIAVISELVDDALALTAQLILRKLDLPPPNVTIAVRSQIPMASGLGSGAAVSTALARALCAALGVTLDDAALNAIIYEVEKIHHGTPSGIDNTVVVYGQPVYFRREQPIQTFTIGATLSLLIGDTGQGALTRVAVGDVRALFNTDPVRTGAVFDEIGALVADARRAIELGDVSRLGALMTRNHELLKTLTVSSPQLDCLVGAALASGALGAKLSGGGRGGNMIALVTQQTNDAVQAALIRAGAARVFTTTLEKTRIIGQSE